MREYTVHIAGFMISRAVPLLYAWSGVAVVEYSGNCHEHILCKQHSHTSILVLFPGDTAEINLSGIAMHFAMQN